MVVSGDQIDDKRIERPVSLIDVYSTVLDAAGIIEDESDNRSYSRIWMSL
ncbi:hypothetical protein SAMN05444422_111125 [Halobiforma haloterrestris]|uniref:Uncharacterized protein n=1 Tax=Natronobacterium haloterrestre TaxID=148448 RepID=A0A1I1KPD8_NATHA|nr:hypothetical protein SAMN05444422_111125 [Halobiforma haloterrestris]